LDAAIDSVTINHLIRNLKMTKKKSVKQIETNLDKHIDAKRLIIGMDKAYSLADEWKKTCGEEVIQMLLINWKDRKGIKIIQPRPISSNVSKKLRIYGFQDTIDKLLIRIALALTDKIVVTNDGDFWDPHDHSCIGDADAPVAKLCYERLDVLIILPDQLMKRLNAYS